MGGHFAFSDRLESLADDLAGVNDGLALVGARPLHLLSQTALPLKSPTGAFIAPLRFANAVTPQTLLRTDEEELCQFDTIPPTTERNRAFPTGNALLYISLSYVDFFRMRPFRAHPVFVLRKNLRNKS